MICIMRNLAILINVCLLLFNMWHPLHYLLLILICSTAYGQQTALQHKIQHSLPLSYAHANEGIIQMQNLLDEAKIQKDSIAQALAHEALCKLYMYLCKKENALKALDDLHAISNNNKLIEAKYLLLQSYHYYINKNENKAFENYSHLSALMRGIKNPDLQIDFAMYEGNRHFNKNDSAIQHYMLAAQLATAQDNVYKKVLAQIALANLYRIKKADYVTALAYTDSVIALSKASNFTAELTIAINIKGGIYIKQSKYDLSMQCLIEALRLCKANNNIIQQINCLMRLGIVEDKLAHYTNSVAYYHQAINTSINQNYLLELPLLYQNMAVAMEHVYPDSTIPYHQKAIAIAIQLYDKRTQAFSLYNMGEILGKKNQYAAAKKNMYEALQLFEELNEPANIGWLLPCIVEFELANANTNGISATPLKAMLDKALALNANGNNYETLEDIYNCYITIYQAENNLVKANEMQHKLIALKDTVFNRQRIKDGMELAEKLNVAEQKNTIAMLNLKHNQTLYQRNTAILIFSFLAIMGIAFYFINKKRVQRKNQINLLAQKENFRNQLSSDLHDEVGSMLTGLALQSDVLSAQANAQQQKSLQEISVISRQAMEQMRDIVWALDSTKDTYDNLFDKMIAHAEYQLALKDIVPSFRFENFKDKQDISPVVRQQVYLIFKEAIANILKHSNATQVTMEIMQQSTGTIMHIKDNGTAQSHRNTHGAGLSSMRNRAAKINGRLHIDTTNGFTITLQF